MPSIRQELAQTHSARWYQTACATAQRAAWAERLRCYAALSAVLADHAAGAAEGDVPARGSGGGRRGQPPIALSGLVTLVARRAHFAGAEPVYRRFRHQHEGRAIARWAGPDPAVKPAVALVAEAKITTFWPYREEVIRDADARDMAPGEWAVAYLRAVAAWATRHRPLAACHPAGPPECVREDMLVLARTAPRAARLHDLAGVVVQAILADARITPPDAVGLVRAEARQLLAMPTASLADQLARTIAELADRVSHGWAGDALSADQAARLLSMASDLSTLLAGGPGLAGHR